MPPIATAGNSNGHPGKKPCSAVNPGNYVIMKCLTVDKLVRVDETAYNKLKAMSEETGIPMEDIISNLVNDTGLQCLHYGR